MEDDNQNIPSASSPVFPQAETPSQVQGGHPQSPLTTPMGKIPCVKGMDVSVFRGDIETKGGNEE